MPEWDCTVTFGMPPSDQEHMAAVLATREQRRYEIAKAVMATLAGNAAPPFAMVCARHAVEFADALLAELDK